jgi:hypothetical protein
VRCGVLLGLLLALLGGTTSAAPRAVAQSDEPPPPIVVSGAADGVVAITASSPHIVVPLRGTPAPTEVSAAISAFTGPSGENVPATVGRPTFTGSTGIVRITAPLPLGGPYVADLVLAHDGVVDPPVAVYVTRTRTRPPAPFTLDGLRAFSVESTELGSISIEPRFTLRATTGIAVPLQSPIVVQAFEAVDGRMSPVDVTVTGIKPDDVDETTCRFEGHTVTLRAAVPCPLILTLDLPAAMATYHVTVRFTAPGHPPVDEELTIHIRRPWYAALAVMLIGVLPGVVLVWLLWPALKRRRMHAAVARLRQDVDATIRRLDITDECERRVVDGLSMLVGALDDTADGDTRTAVRAQAAALAPWIVLHRAIARAGLDVPEEYEQYKAQLDRIAKDLGKVATDEAKGLRERLQDLQWALDKHTLDKAKKAAEDLRGELCRLPESVDQHDLDKALDAVKAADTAERAADPLTRAQDIAVRRVGDRFKSLLVQDARALSLPVNGTRWNMLRARVREERVHGQIAAPFEERVRQLSQAERALLSGIATAVIDDLDTWVTPSSTTTPNGNGLDESRGDLIEELRTVRRDADAGRVDEARTAYGAAVKKWKEVQEKARKVGRWRRPDEEPLLPEVPVVAIEPFRRTAVGPLPGEAGPLRHADPRAREKWLWWVSVAVAIPVSLLACFAALYVGHPTWGAADDLIASLLWGLGLTAVGSAAAFAAAHVAVTR